MTTEQQMVLDFMTKFQQEAPDKPKIPSSAIRRLRAKLILEEAMETIRALGFHAVSMYTIELEETHDPDIIALADGLADLHYVAYCGTAVAFGIDMEPIFAEVHRSNMSKLWKGFELCDAEKAGYNITFDNQKFQHLVRNNYGKVIKSPSYSPAQLEPLLTKQGFKAPSQT